MSCGAVAEIYAGDTSDVWEVGFVTSAPGALPIELAALDGNFSCRIAVMGSDIARAVTGKNQAANRFRAYLTPAETEALGPGDWTVGIELRNPTLDPPLVQEVHRRIRILEQAVPAA